ncbi:vp39 capsid protein [Orgyia leucostigma nucleopolyhedrovirus]|uniref:Vp39 capsid protein n=1 Tax=Orgyia leucostigma nucleopolyhedrovirus TaxID=490711 RepID=B0FDU5_9ABAC|nr:vp39 capsid protein [Orgyia leucostigma nucleopolyhedrovirus]ABY65803.1 vp39 capsid protein [Orgyia leucostigma nucleopolyhedrovirus]
MSLAPALLNATRRKSYCVFNAVQPLDGCRSYGSPCTNDNTVDDGFYICDGHLLALKMEKMSLPIPDADGNTYNRTLARSLVTHTDVGDKRILVPTKNNYQTVLHVNNLSNAEQLVWHMIYENESEQERICKLLEANEDFRTRTYPIADNIFSATTSILAMTNPRRYCSRVNSSNDRIWGANDVDNEAGRAFLAMPPFMQNLINKAVAPEKMRIDDNTLLIRESPTCHIRENGLVADVALYNPKRSKYISDNENLNVIRMTTNLKFEGNAYALQRQLTRYEAYEIGAPLFLGEQIVTTANTAVPARVFTVSDLSAASNVGFPLGTTTTTAAATVPIVTTESFSAA